MSIYSKLKKSAPFRKGSAVLLQVPRALHRTRATPEDYATNPPIVVNSLPKSGTHLVMQVARALPGTRYYGSFIAQSPSVSMRLRNQTEITSRIAKIAPGEVLGAHLHYTDATAVALAESNVLHLFIHRDPRDVVVSESHYLAEMNRWHRLHREFKRISDPQKRIRLAIDGTDLPSYPAVGERFRAFLGWVDHPDCLSLRYEDLVDPRSREDELKRIIAAFAQKGGNVGDQDRLLDRLIQAIDPKKSHTFRKGGTERWRVEMNAQNQELMLKHFPDLPP